MNEHLECVLAIITVIHQRILELYVNICKPRSKSDTHLKKRKIGHGKKLGRKAPRRRKESSMRTRTKKERENHQGKGEISARTNTKGKGVNPTRGNTNGKRQIGPHGNTTGKRNPGAR